MKRQFTVISIKSLQRRQPYRLVIDFEQLTVSFHKLKNKQEVRRIFNIAQCVKLNKHKTDPNVLTVTFNHIPPHYIKTLLFTSTVKTNGQNERDLFCDLIHAVIVTGNKPYKVWKSLQQQHHLEHHSQSTDNKHTTALDENELDFYTFLISFSSAETQTSDFSTSKSLTIESTNNDFIDSTTSQYISPSNHVSYNTAPAQLSVSSIASPAVSQHHTQSLSWSTATPSNGLQSVRGSVSNTLQNNNNSDVNDFVTNNTINETELTDIDGVQLLLGEQVIVKQPHVTYLHTINTTRGDIYLTNYRIMYRDYQTRRNRTQSRAQLPELEDLSLDDNNTTQQTEHTVDFALGFITRIVRVTPTQLRFICKDGNRLEFTFDASSNWVDGFYRHILLFTYPKQITSLFAFSHQYELGPNDSDGWQVYSFTDEFKRIGLLDTYHSPVAQYYRSTQANTQFTLCSTYPQQLIVPASIDDTILRNVVLFRSKERLPTAVWLHPVTHATLIRCAQPLPGVRGKRSIDDEQLITAYRQCGQYNDNSIYIMDARPYRAAMGNTVMGKGTENIAYYDCAQLEYMNIENIHSIRQSHEQLIELCNTIDLLQDDKWLTKLDSTQWLYHIRLLLIATNKICQYLCCTGTSVIIHCSDGWDRTSQLCSLVELILDPHYRTLHGFAILIEKEWLSFGHRFHERHGHADPNFNDDQRAPIFLHWLDCCYQLQQQYPTAFEFNAQYLIDLYDYTYNCRFGTFLYNSTKDRMNNQLHTKTVSVWTYMLSHNNKHRYINPLYQPVQSPQYNIVPTAHLTTMNKSLYCIPDTSPRAIVLWEALYLRYNKQYCTNNAYQTLCTELYTQLQQNTTVTPPTTFSTNKRSNGNSTEFNSMNNYQTTVYDELNTPVLSNAIHRDSTDEPVSISSTNEPYTADNVAIENDSASSEDKPNILRTISLPTASSAEQSVIAEPRSLVVHIDSDEQNTVPTQHTPTVRNTTAIQHLRQRSGITPRRIVSIKARIDHKLLLNTKSKLLHIPTVNGEVHNVTTDNVIERRSSTNKPAITVLPKRSQTTYSGTNSPTSEHRYGRSQTPTIRSESPVDMTIRSSSGNASPHSPIRNFANKLLHKLHSNSGSSSPTRLHEQHSNMNSILNDMG